MESETQTIHNLFVKLLNGKTLTLKFNSPKISGETLIHQIKSHLPLYNDYLFLTEGRHVSPESQLSSNDHRLFPTVHVLARLCGGKGGFGSLLRGAATKAGQKKTNNFDACRDMNGRRLRHVNAEKKLEEWREEEEGRRLEKSAEEFLKKNEKKHAKENVKGDTAVKYVEKFREVSKKCRAQMKDSVKESIGSGGKRKGVVGMKGADAKRLKIWMGKTKIEDSDSDSDENGSDNEGNDKSVVLNNKHQLDSHKEVEGGSSSTVSCENLGESSSGDLSKNEFEENIEIAVQGCPQFSASPGANNDVSKSTDLVELENHEMVVQSSYLVTEVVKVEKHDPECNLLNTQDIVAQTLCDFNVAKEDVECITVNLEANGFPKNINNSATDEDSVITNVNLDVEKPLNFDDYSSAAEMEVLGIERIKYELQTHGLKFGGTLKERAARLFLLKTTPLEKIPKKLLAKK